ncbi:MAG: mechanosensitive ion channel family protein [Armatimonadaceae bacterium]
MSGYSKNWQVRFGNRGVRGQLFQRICCLLWLAVFGFIPGTLPVYAQIPGLTAPSEPALPAGVQRNGVVETAPVIFDGNTLFRIASPAVLDRNAPGEQIPVEVRAQQVERQLNQVLEYLRTLDDGAPENAPTPLETDAVNVVTEELNRQYVVMVRGRELTTPQLLVTVTQTDADFFNTTSEQLAAQWSEIIEENLATAVRIRRPEEERERLLLVAGVAVAVPALHLILAGISLLIARRQKSIEETLAAQKETNASEGELVHPEEKAAEVAEAREAPPSFDLVNLLFALQSQMQVLIFLRWLLFWLIVTVWVAGIGFCLYLFPVTRRFAITFASAPLVILVALFAAGLLNRIGSLVIDRFMYNWEKNRLQGDGETDTARDSMRALTVGSAIKGLKFALIYGSALFWVLGRLNLVSWSVITIGAILALAVSFAAQSLVKDLVMGFLILVEDQYAINDYVVIGETKGTVESMNLRITQVRTYDGKLVTIPNNLINRVENWSRTWSMADIRVQIPSDADVDRVLDLVRTQSREMAEEDEWRDKILNPEQWSGVLTLDRTGIEIQLAVQTMPLQHWAIGRELRRRIKNALDREGIVIGAQVALAVSGN